MNKQQAIFVARLAREVPGWTATEVADVAAALIRHGRALDAIAVRDCNGEARPTDERSAETRHGSILALLCGTGIHPIYSGDPRGCVLKLRVPSGITDDWGHVGMCVPYK